VRTTRFWNNLYQVCSNTKYRKAKWYKTYWEQES